MLPVYFWQTDFLGHYKISFDRSLKDIWQTTGWIASIIIISPPAASDKKNGSPVWQQHTSSSAVFLPKLWHRGGEQKEAHDDIFLGWRRNYSVSETQGGGGNNKYDSVEVAEDKEQLNQTLLG